MSAQAGWASVLRKENDRFLRGHGQYVADFGMKEMGQGGAVYRSAAVVCVLSDALRGSGAEMHNLPLTPERILDVATAVLRGAR